MPSIETLRFYSIIFIYSALFGTAAWDKLKSFTTPDWFVKQFSNTFVAKLPGGAKLQYWVIALIEAALFVCFVASIFQPGLLFYALSFSLYFFGLLLIGLRLTYDFQGSANMFVYFGVTLLALMILLSAPPVLN